MELEQSYLTSKSQYLNVMNSKHETELGNSFEEPEQHSLNEWPKHT